MHKDHRAARMTLSTCRPAAKRYIRRCVLYHLLSERLVGCGAVLWSLFIHLESSAWPVNYLEGVWRQPWPKTLANLAVQRIKIQVVFRISTSSRTMPKLIHNCPKGTINSKSCASQCIKLDCKKTCDASIQRKCVWKSEGGFERQESVHGSLVQSNCPSVVIGKPQ